MSKLLQVGGAISIVLGIVSVVMLLNDAFNIGWVSPLKRMLEYYLWVKSISVGLMEPYIIDALNWLLRWTDFDWRISDHWSDVFILMSLYFGARAKAYWSASLTGRATFRFVWGVLIALAFSIASGLLPPTDAKTNFILGSTPILGMLFFELADSAVSATFARKGGLSWIKDFFRYIMFSGPVLLLGVGLIAAICYSAQDMIIASSSALGLSALILFSMLLTVYWAIRGLAHAVIPKNRDPSESILQRFKRSSNTQIATAMGLTLGGAILWVAMNAGLALIGLERSTL